MLKTRGRHQNNAWNPDRRAPGCVEKQIFAVLFKSGCCYLSCLHLYYQFVTTAVDIYFILWQSSFRKRQLNTSFSLTSSF